MKSTARIPCYFRLAQYDLDDPNDAVANYLILSLQVDQMSPALSVRFSLIFGSDRSSRNANVCSFVRLSIYSMKVCLEHTIFIFWPQILQDDFRIPQSTRTALKSHSDFVIPSEPKILRLVLSSCLVLYSFDYNIAEDPS